MFGIKPFPDTIALISLAFTWNFIIAYEAAPAFCFSASALGLVLGCKMEGRALPPRWRLVDGLWRDRALLIDS